MAARYRKKVEKTRNRLTANFKVHGKEQKFADCSLYLFESDNKFRYYCVWLVEWKWFENVLTLCILINAINIASNDYEVNLTGKENKSAFYVVKNIIDKIITVLFILECAAKVIA